LRYGSLVGAMFFCLFSALKGDWSELLPLADIEAAQNAFLGKVDL
jgi:hypothetical protein